MAKKILVIDDDNILRKIVVHHLKKHEFEIEEAVNGKEGLEKLKEFKPDLVILDALMPIMSGYDFLKVVRGDPTYKDLKILMLSANAMEDEKKLGLELGADYYETKPFEINKFIARVKGILK